MGLPWAPHPAKPPLPGLPSPAGLGTLPCWAQSSIPAGSCRHRALLEEAEQAWLLLSQLLSCCSWRSSSPSQDISPGSGRSLLAVYLESALSSSPRPVADGEGHHEQRGEQFGLPVYMDWKNKRSFGSVEAVQACRVINLHLWLLKSAAARGSQI